MVFAPVVGCRQFAFDSPLAESRTDDDAVSIAQLYGDIFVGQLFAVNELDVGFPIVVSSGLLNRFQDGFIRILQVVFTY